MPARWPHARPPQNGSRDFQIHAQQSERAQRDAAPPTQSRAWLPNAQWLLAPNVDPATNGFRLLALPLDQSARRREFHPHTPWTPRRTRETDPPLASSAWLQMQRFPRHFSIHSQFHWIQPLARELAPPRLAPQKLADAFARLGQCVAQFPEVFSASLDDPPPPFVFRFSTAK